MDTATSQVADLPRVSAEINYAGDIRGQARFDHLNPSGTNVVWASATVEIRDVRPVRDQLSLDREGFVLLTHESVLAGAADPEPLVDDYLAETTDLIRRVTGASHVAPQPTWWNVLIRSTGNALGTARPRPGRFVHLDYSEADAYRFADHIRRSGGDRVPAHGRFAVYQTWRSLSGPPQDSQLALTDGRSVSRSRTRVVEHVIGPREAFGGVFESLLCDRDDAHRWYYFSDARPDELVLFLGFDSAHPGRTNVAHTAFDVPAAGRTLLPRTSIESRYFAFFE
ncbi:hypothetical protein CC117_24075 [Parafrankia colletiae]|uniref:Methyltransferase n=1 Tax=Parafrankia colletiae TaxID=573497 RepID=A0A1S1QGY0_9ACTN|nr:CmcJ/NvfI family oxidoreductase [Parafrankia colletiae]MCK9901924.1 hypothetical protein [Frankia sp. Cpl3]OHV32876.1 hypothetical protein CC117_24075 [Parafrankia colletiae]